MAPTVKNLTARASRSLFEAQKEARKDYHKKTVLLHLLIGLVAVEKGVSSYTFALQSVTKRDV